MALTRRQLLGASAASLGLGAGATAGLLRPRPAFASVSRSELRFVFVRIFGGWDTTRVFATEFDNPDVHMEGPARLGQVGDLRYVEHPRRPTVTSFMQNWYDRTLFVNGLVVPSVNHRICEQLALTGTNAAVAPDWPTLIAALSPTPTSLPHVVVAGQAIPGHLGSSVIRIGNNGQLENLLSGALLDQVQPAVSRPGAELERMLDRYATEEAQARAAAQQLPGGQRIYDAFEGALRRAQVAKELQTEVAWNTDGSFNSQVDLAVDLLSIGMSRCATLAFERLTWDSHESNDSKQLDNFEDLFVGLSYLMRELEAAPGTVQASLADETVVVVMSEMGRTPQLNMQEGKDHWAHTSAMIVGPTITGGRVVGGYDPLFYGERVDLASGELSEGGRELTPGIFGATLLAMADVDPEPLLPEDSPIEGILL